MTWIEESFFKEVQRVMPIPCVDLLVVHKGRLLLMLRNNEPAKNYWFTPGGRILKGEPIEKAVKRVLLKETKLTPIKIEKKGVMDHIYSYIHTVSIFFRVDVDNDNLKLDEQHTKFKWITEIDESLHPFVKDMITKSNIF
jgi:colanic acid biosynthesis protein WcaH